MSGDRIILHCDCDSFFASVETVLDPSLKNVPLAVTGDPESRHGIVLAKNQLAKKYGVTTPEPIWQAKRKCPDLVCVKSHHDVYREFSKRINEIYVQYTDLVEPFSVDESYLDVTGSIHLFGMTPKELADHLRDRIREEIGVTISVGVSFCKAFAKLGSDYNKPDGTTVIMREDIERIVYPLPVSDLMFVGKKAAQVLQSMSITTCGDLAKYDRDFLEKALGKQGVMVWKYINGLDDEPVESFYTARDPKSIGHETTFPADIKGEQEIKAAVNDIADGVVERLRKKGKYASVIQIKIKDPSFKTIQRQTTLSKPTHLKKEIASIAMDLIRENWDLSKPIRLISITGAGLLNEGEQPETQMSLFSEELSQSNEQQETIESTIDDLRKRFGKSVISQGFNGPKSG